MTAGEMYNNTSNGSQFETNNITDSCYDSLAPLQAAMDNRTDVFVGGIVNYTLCPNTMIVLDERDARTFLVPRINSRIRCGTTGRSTNNCTVSGGKTQVGIVYESLEVYQNNYVIEGLTFELSRGPSSLLAAPGVIEYRDCVFRDQGVAFILDHIGSGDGTVDSDATSLEVVLDGCRFEANTLVADNVFSCLGLVCVHSKGVRLTVRNCVFLNNDVAYKTDRSVLIDVAEGARLVLDTNCFVNNTAVGPGLINLHQPQDFVTTTVDSNNGRGNVIQRTTCAATHVFTTDECVAFGAPSCDQLPAAPANPVAPSSSSSSARTLRLVVPVSLLVVLVWLMESSL